MKKALTLVMALLAISSHAASISWNASTGATKFDGSSVGKNAMGYIVYLGSATLDSYTYADILAMDTVKEAATSLGKWTNTKVTVDSANTGNYAMYMSFVSGEKTYYNVSSTLYNLTSENIQAFLDEGTAIPTGTYTFSDSKPASSTATAKAGAGWVAVPEPSTAALALAGLALLLKRRKA